MNLLCLDTSGQSLSVALVQDGKLRGEMFAQTGLTHSDLLMPFVDFVLRSFQLEAQDIDLFAAVTGPGSFTGVRIGVETVKALSHAAQKPCLGINALEALARGALPFEGVIAPLQDARAGQVYAAAYHAGEAILPDQAVKLNAFLSQLPENLPVCFCGDGALVHHASIAETLKERAVFLPDNRCVLHAADAALLAWERREEAGHWEALLPYYLRAPQAERERLAREAAQNG